MSVLVRRIIPALLLVFFVGCASIPDDSDVVSSAALPVETLAPELSSFLRRVQRESRLFEGKQRPDFLLLLDLDHAHTVRDTLEQRELVPQRALSRARFVASIGVTGETVQTWVGGRFPRFWTAIGLSAHGWRRDRPGLWHDEEGTEVTLYRGGLIHVSTTDRLLVANRVKSGTTRSSVAEVIARLASEPAVVVYLDAPDVSSVLGGSQLGSLEPEDLLIQILHDDALELTLRFAGETEARVVLVVLRLAYHRILDALILTAGEGFSLVRDGTVIRMSGVRGTGASVERVFDTLLAVEREEER